MWERSLCWAIHKFMSEMKFYKFEDARGMQLMITVQGYKVVRNTLAMQSHYTPIIIINSIYQPAHTFPELSLITLHIQWVCQSVCVCVCVCVYISSVLSLELRVSIVWDTRLSAQTNKHWALIAKLRILRCGAIGPTCMSVHTHTHTHTSGCSSH